MSDEQRVVHEDELNPEAFEWNRKDDIKEGIHMLLSHHPPSLYGHCLRVSFRGRSLYFCGRCTGIYSGLGLGIILLVLFQIDLNPEWFWFLFSVILGFTTVVDWVSQRLTPRKTTNHIRAVTGFCSGFGLAIIFLMGNLFYMLVALSIMAGSVGIVGLIENRRRTKSLTVMRAKFEAEDAKDEE
ncbi:DUF2085 domain-containing protein [Candidatus Thorarchaeota archaeon]|nr:MAG: DUF2085 domain-containing protein [Candidatus Thorarchaeota archaeon]